MSELDNRKRTLAATAALCAIVLFWPLAASAHVGSGEAGGFVTGLLHPVSGLDHVLAMVAVGLWGAQLRMPAIWILPVAFPLVMALGGLLGLLGIPLPGVEVGIAASAIVLGAMVLGAVRPPLWLALVLVSVFAVFHGHAHGTELPAGQSGLAYSLGFVIATGLLHACGIAIGLINHWRAGAVVLRAVGAAVAVGGVYFLAGAVG